ncbi:MAG TPA: hypothetical protein VL294_12190 [Pseudolysinimonas sp.]|jgi:hypothetical protein|nr:hypothetical protein [Pseudolysinimonas sp.]
MNPLEDDPDPTPAELTWWQSGGHPPWKRLWRDGVDVTDEPVEAWPIARLTVAPRSRAGRSARH